MNKKRIILRSEYSLQKKQRKVLPIIRDVIKLNGLGGTYWIVFFRDKVLIQKPKGNLIMTIDIDY